MPSNMSHVLEAATCHGRAHWATHAGLADATAARMHAGDLEAPDPQPFSVEYGGVLLDSRFACRTRVRASSQQHRLRLKVC